MIDKDVKKILSELNLSALQAPTLSEWQNFLLTLEERQYGHHEGVQAVAPISLGKEEMQAVWDLIQSRESMINAILGASQDIILTLNQEKQVLEFNKAAEEFFGISKDAVLGKSIFSIVRGGSLFDDLKSALEFSSYDGGFFECSHERTMIIREDTEIPVSVLASRVRSGEKYVYPIYLRDLTSQKQAEKLIENSRAQMMLSSKLSALGEMAGGVAHEINTPLAIIQMRAGQLLECMSEDIYDKKMFTDALLAIDKTVKRIAKIVQGLKTFARDGKNDPFEKTSINQVIEETFSLCREKFYHHGVQLFFEPTVDLTINCRTCEISQVLLNLLNNAFDAIEKLDDRWVRVEVIEEADHVAISIIDSGEGIPVDIQEKIMNPFFTTKDVGKGTGLGLSISRGIIEAHNGSIHIDNNCENTKFCLRLPKGARAAA